MLNAHLIDTTYTHICYINAWLSLLYLKKAQYMETVSTYLYLHIKSIFKIHEMHDEPKQQYLFFPVILIMNHSHSC